MKKTLIVHFLNLYHLNNEKYEFNFFSKIGLLKLKKRPTKNFRLKIKALRKIKVSKLKNTC